MHSRTDDMHAEIRRAVVHNERYSVADKIGISIMCNVRCASDDELSYKEDVTDFDDAGVLCACSADK